MNINEHSSYTFQLQARPSSTLQGMLAWTPKKYALGMTPDFPNLPNLQFHSVDTWYLQ